MMIRLGKNTPANRVEVRPEDVKTYSSKGKTYHYHRPTGQRLPDNIDEPGVLAAAIQKIEDQQRIGSELPAIIGLDVDIPACASELKPEMQSLAVAFTMPAVVGFVLRAKAKETLHYHSGDLALDGSRDQLLRIRQAYLRAMAEFGAVHLRQQRVRPNWSHYFATRSTESLTGIPKHLMHADISPDEYTALVAVNERQSAKAVSRCIRDALGITDQAASTIRNDMILRGWLTNGRPPELTDLGLSLLG